MTTATQVKISTLDVEKAFAALHMLLESKNISDAAESAAAAITKACEKMGYERTKHLGPILKAYQQKVAAGAPKHTDLTEAATDILSEAGFYEVAKMVNGPAPANTQAAPSSAAEDAGEATARTAAEPAGPATAKKSPSAASAQSDDAGQGKVEGLPPMLSFRVSGDTLASINFMLKQVSGEVIDDINALMEATSERFVTLNERRALMGRIEQKLALLKAGDEESLAAADKIDTKNPAPMLPSRFSRANVKGDLLPGLNSMLQGSSNGAIPGVAEVVDMLRQAEHEIGQIDNSLRAKMREVRKMAPRKAAKVTIDGRVVEDEPDIECQVVMRLASEVFDQNVYGHISELLDFEIPTLVWDEKHPDVPEIDGTFKFHALALADALHSLRRGKLMLLYGESGCGKSEFWLNVAARLGFPLFRLNMDSHQVRADLIGQHRIIEGPGGQPITEFVEGIIPRALKQPSLLLIDEFDCADPEITPILQPVLEGRGVVLLEDGGRYIRPHEWSRIGMTGNSNGHGSSNQMYISVQQQSAATLDRIEKFMKMPYLPAEMEVEVVMSRLPHADKDFVEKLVQLGNKMREAYELERITQLCSTRRIQEAAERHADFRTFYQDEQTLIHDTLDNCLLNRSDTMSRPVIKELIDEIF